MSAFLIEESVGRVNRSVDMVSRTFVQQSWRQSMKSFGRDVARSSMAVCLGLSVIVPFLNHYRIAPSGSFHSEVAAGLFFLLAVLASVPLLPRGEVLVDRAMPLGASLLALLIGGHWAVGMTSYAFGPLAWLVLLSLFLVAFTWGQLIGQDEELRALVFVRLCWAVVIAASANALAQLIQVSGHAQTFAPYVITANIEGSCRVSGNVNQANHANTLAWMGLSALVFLRSQRKLMTFGVASFAALMMLSSALTTSRTAWLFAFMFAILVWLSGRSCEGFRRRRAALIVSLVAGLVAATVLAGNLLGEHCASSGERFFSERERQYNSQRVDFARNAVMIWRNEPLFGAGPGRFRAASFDLPVERDKARSIDYYAHNIFLQFLAEFGIAGLGILLAIVLLYGRRLARWRTRTPPFWLAVSWLALVGLHSLVENAFAYAFFLIPAAISLGAVIPVGGGTRGGMRVRTKLAAAITSIFGMSAALALVLDYDNLTHLDMTANLALNMGAHESPEAAKRLSEIRETIWIYEPYADLTLLGLRNLSMENKEEIRSITKRVNRIFPTAETTYYSIMLATLDGEMDEATLLIKKLKVYFSKQSDQYVSKMYKVSSERAEFGALKSLVAPEVSLRP